MTTRTFFAILSTAALGCAVGPTDDEDPIDHETAAHTTSMGGTTAWQRQASSPITRVAATPSNEVVIGGSFTSTIEVDGTRVSIDEDRFDDVFLAKVDAFGEVIWLRSIGASYDDRLLELSVGPSGETLVAILNETFPTDLGCGASTTPGFYITIGRLDGAGRCVWSHSIPWDLESHHAELELAGMPDGTTLLGASFANGQMALRGATLKTRGTDIDESELFLARLAPADGRVLWQRRYVTTTTNDEAGVSLRGLGADGSGNMVFGAVSGDSIDFGGGTLAAGRFLVKLRSSGSLAWARRPGIDGTLAVDRASGAIAVAGMSFGDGTTSVRVERYGSTGAFRWSRTIDGGSARVFLADVAIDHHGHVAVAGTFQDGSISIAGRIWTTPNDALGAWVAMFGSTSGTVRWSRAFVDARTRGSVIAYDLDVSTNSRPMLVGWFDRSADFGEDEGPLVVDNDSGFPNGYLVRIFP